MKRIIENCRHWPIQLRMPVVISTRDYLPVFLRRKPSLKVVLPAFVAFVCLILLFANHKLNEYRLEYLYRGAKFGSYDGFRDDSGRLYDLFEKGEYDKLVDAMEAEYQRYGRCMAKLGGLEEVTRMKGYRMRALGHGVSNLFGDMHPYVEHNAQYTPKSIEYLLMDIWLWGRPFTNELKSFAETMSQSTHPMIQAYGMWFLMRDERSKLKYHTYEELMELMHDAHHPHFDAYRGHVYRHAMDGEAWAYGFAAGAARCDPDRTRALEAKRYYEKVAPPN